MRAGTRLTDFFMNGVNAIKDALLGQAQEDSPSDIVLTDEQALELFAEIRAMELSHKSEVSDGAGCNLRAHAIYEILAERGVKNIQKGWISSPLTSNGKPNFLIKSPVEIKYTRHARNFGESAANRVTNDEPFNIHVAPVITTAEGRRLVFDTYFYDAPPELEQWRDDFKPYEEGVELKFELTEPDYLYFNEIGSPLPEKGSVREMVSRGKSHLEVKNELRKLDLNPVDTPLKAKWLEDRRNAEPQRDSGPESGL